MSTTPSDEPVTALELRGLKKSFGNVTAVANVDLSVPRGEFLTLLGPSGSGKTTILRMIAGFEQPSGGSISIDGRDISRLSPAKRGIGIVFQHYALFPHMTVAENIRYPLKRRRWPRAEADARVQEMLELVRLPALGARLPRELSGGQQQRVALARALSFRPALLLMDEPLGALDRALRIEMEEEIRRIHHASNTTVVYVTHDQEEALAMSERIGVMRDGLLLQEGAPHVLYERPADTFVATFFGDCALLPIEMLVEECTDTAVVRVIGVELEAPLSAPLRGREPLLAVRPDRLSLEPLPGDVVLPARVIDSLYLGGTVRLTCEAEGVGRIVAQVDSRAAAELERGSPVRIGFAPDQATVIPRG